MMMGKTITMSIDQYATCAECGHKGSLPSGLCLGCATKAMGTETVRSRAALAVRREFREAKRKETASMGTKPRGLVDPAPKGPGKDSDPKAPHVERKEITKNLRCELTEAELLQQGQMMAQAQQDGNLAQEEFDSIKTDFKAKIEGFALAASRSGNMIRSKFEFRPVKCERVLDFDKAVVTEIRLDTGVEIEKRPMTTDESQMGLPMEVGSDPE